jgi:two-component system, LuxR family, response regulator FixJ
MRMPEFDGIELPKRLKAVRCMFPVIIMTGHGDVALAAEAIKLGAVDFLEKPFEDDRLIGMIETAIKQAEPDARSEAAALDIASRIATLSPRERQVMDALIAGLSNKLIVREYDISPRTIEVYSRSLLWDFCHGKTCIKCSLEPERAEKARRNTNCSGNAD